MDVSVIFVNWNSTDYLRASIASIYQWARDLDFEIIVVDNASPTRDYETLKDEFDDILLIQSKENLGFAGANNLGFRHSKGQWLLFLNPDTELISPAINVLFAVARGTPNAGIVGCKLLNSDYSVQTSCIQSFPTILNQVLDIEWLRLRSPKSRLWGIAPLFADDPMPSRVEVVSGACMMVRREVFEEVGTFSEEYFMYAEDLDLCQKTVRAGYTNYYTGQAKVVHHGGKSSSPNSATARKWNAVVRYLAKFRGPIYAKTFRVVMVAVACARIGFLQVWSRLRGNASRGGFALAKWQTILATLWKTQRA